MINRENHFSCHFSFNYSFMLSLRWIQTSFCQTVLLTVKKNTPEICVLELFFCTTIKLAPSQGFRRKPRDKINWKVPSSTQFSTHNTYSHTINLLQLLQNISAILVLFNHSLHFDNFIISIEMNNRTFEIIYIIYHVLLLLCWLGA